MARKSLRDMSGIANTIARSSSTATERPPKTSAPALGALQGSLASIREIDPGLIDDWGPKDRLDEFTTVNAEDDGEGFEALKNSIREGGQQVPILVRRSKAAEGRFEAIYGRRRLKACRELGIKVRANVQDVDDTTALLAKGLENAARRNLSFYEKARFAEAIQAAGHENATVRQVLNLTASGHSHLTKVTQNVPSRVGDLIGAAPKSGRPRWTDLAELFLERKLTEKVALDLLTKISASLTSDERLEALIKEASKRGTKVSSGPREITPMDGVVIKAGRGSVSLSVKKSGTSAEFASWLESNLEEIIKRSYTEFTDVNSEGDK
ncbi:plasmid partitioning protein RepB [Sulfitobacter pseudonitzschiae]|uniref:Chromosome partitioning protein ParB n=2 Tax=Alphaproteobacteria TaxID=28211 RepID=A0A0A0E925_9RHOB|nr:chromosome partitioning protein ParB [Pseudooceanicola atlanticus]MBM1818149.1 plasmid partitioning protein RepB [Pseudosulfitobacter pseudonitzschiae]MBM1835143.1 plasmid partitioning protein RepB [Pseudosulfitobacter pseudonitzschiae]MBM1840016.1 plasmid partitioning protein RepB [Pseudosulfitobacter pseudonitzschiae]MBM1844879.1 plasmid partitioning protein RepB [Pseudosulfitobacter pseudonitzschiae]